MDDRTDAVTTPTNGQLVADSIRRKIVLGELRDGDSLPNEAQLLERYQVSRPVLREALRILQSEALLSIRRGSKGGARVNAPHADPVARQAGYLLQYQRTTLADVFRTRALLEPPAVRLLAESRTPEAVDRLHRALQAEAGSLDDPVRAGLTHGDFHTLVVELSGTNTLALFARIMGEITRRHTESVMLQALDEKTRLTNAELAHRVHRKLVQLVAEGKAQDAETLWRSHLDETMEWMLRGQAAREIVDLFS